MKWLVLAVLLAAGALVGPLLLFLMAASFLAFAASAALLAFVGAVAQMAKRARFPRAS